MQTVTRSFLVKFLVLIILLAVAGSFLIYTLVLNRVDEQYKNQQLVNNSVPIRTADLENDFVSIQGESVSPQDGDINISGDIQGSSLTSSAQDGTSPLNVYSSTLVNNLNADMVDGKHAEDLTKTINNQTVNNITNNTIGESIAQGEDTQYFRGDKTWQTLNKYAVGLSNVENTALSTWTGSAYIATLGTVSQGTWNGAALQDAYVADDITLANISQITNRAITDTTGTLTVARGGTGATDASGARTNLGLGTVAIQDADSVSISGGVITGATTWNAGSVTTSGPVQIQGSTDEPQFVVKANSSQSYYSNPLIVLQDYNGSEILRLGGGPSSGTYDEYDHRNLFLGKEAGSSLTVAADSLDGVYNTFIGYDAGRDTTVGSYNTALGSEALEANTVGINNVALGQGALKRSTVGSSNVAIGIDSLGMNDEGMGNVAIGLDSLWWNTSGSHNSSVGIDALFSNTTGNNNVAFGEEGGRTNTTGSNNVFIGYNSDAMQNNLTNAIAIGYKAKVNQSNSLVLGGIGANAVKVGVGVAAPTATIHVVQADATGAVPVIRLEQDDQDESFIDFVGTSSADATKNISTMNGDGTVEGPKNFSSSNGWQFEGMVRIEINGTHYWMPYYSEDTD